MTIASENLRYLLWREKVNRESWAEKLAEWANCSESRAEKLLNDAPLTNSEQEMIAKTTNEREEALQTERFLGNQVHILFENLEFLLDKKIHHKKVVEIAEGIDVSRTAVTRWKKREQEPEEKHLAKLTLYFGLSEINLREDPVFLHRLPVGDLNRREWIKKKVDELDSTKLNKFFPAFEKLLR
jgi:transcriptional regulator with XRE-family HTH domain